MRLATIGASGFRPAVSAPSHRPLAAGVLGALVAVLACAAPLAIAQGAPAAPETAAPAAAAPPVARSAWDAPEPWRTDRFYLETSVFTQHFSSDPKHDNTQDLILVEYNITESWLVGASFFDNSFGQNSQFVYGGYRFRPFENLQQLYFKVAAGVLHGYTGEFKNKIPMNSSGYAPAIVPSVGYCINRFCSEFVLFGTAGFLITAGITLP